MDITSLALAKSFAKKAGLPIYTLDDLTDDNFLFYKSSAFRAGYVSLKGLKKGIYIPYSSKGLDGKTPGYYYNLMIYWEVTESITNSVGYAPIGTDFWIVMEDISENVADGTPLCLYHQPLYSGLVMKLRDSKANFGYGVKDDRNTATEVMFPSKYAKITYEHIYTKLPVSEITPTKDTHFTTKKYVDDTIAAAITSALEGEY